MLNGSKKRKEQRRSSFFQFVIKRLRAIDRQRDNCAHNAQYFKPLMNSFPSIFNTIIKDTAVFFTSLQYESTCGFIFIFFFFPAMIFLMVLSSACVRTFNIIVTLATTFSMSIIIVQRRILSKSHNKGVQINAIDNLYSKVHSPSRIILSSFLDERVCCVVLVFQ